MPELVVIEDATIDQLLRTPELVNVVPCLKNAPTTVKRCSSCPRARAKTVPDYNQIKQCLRGMGGEPRAALKQHFNAIKLRVRYASGRKVVVFTF